MLTVGEKNLLSESSLNVSRVHLDHKKKSYGNINVNMIPKISCKSQRKKLPLEVLTQVHGRFSINITLSFNKHWMAF